MDSPIRKASKKFLTYFLRGLLVVAPAAITIYIVVAFVQFADRILPIKYPGLGAAVIVIVITIIGVFSYSLFFRWFLDGLDALLKRTPLTKMIYSSIKDLFGAFMGEKKMFNQPVMVLMFKDAGIHKIGFITQKDLSEFGITDLVAVYFPHSYNFSGNLYLVPRENVKPLENFPSANALKFVVSGGVVSVSDDEEKK